MSLEEKQTLLKELLELKNSTANLSTVFKELHIQIEKMDEYNSSFLKFNFLGSVEFINIWNSIFETTKQLKRGEKLIKQ